MFFNYIEKVKENTNLFYKGVSENNLKLYAYHVPGTLF